MAGDVFTAPVLHTISRGIIVQTPIGEAAPPAIGEYGGVSVGAGYVPGAGAVVHVAVHQRDGTTVMFTLGRPALEEFAIAMNWATEAVYSGAFDRGEPRQ